MIVQPIGKFKLTYANGISQVKLLITQEDYKSIVKPILDNIAELEAQRSGIVKWFCKRRCADISNLYIFNLQRNSEHL